MDVFSIVLQSLLVLYYLFSGGAKLAGVKYWTDIFHTLRLPRWLLAVTGIVQLIGAAALIAGYWYAEAVAAAALWLGITMLLACLAHFRVKDSIGKTAPALLFLALVLTLTLINLHDVRQLFL